MVIGDADDLSRYRYHTGASLRPLAPDERYPALFRDLGSVAAARYLRGELSRLAGPQTPLLYMRTIEYVEPYVDHEDIGRLVFLRPTEIAPWHSGVPHVYVARASRTIEADAVGYVPGGISLERGVIASAGATSAAELREALGSQVHDDACADTLERLEALNTELAMTELLAEPLRWALQSSDTAVRSRAGAEMERLGISESDLCTAWHHLPRERRASLRDQLARLDGSPVGAYR
jgi:hypothetical protein